MSFCSSNRRLVFSVPLSAVVKYWISAALPAVRAIVDSEIGLINAPNAEASPETGFSIDPTTDASCVPCCRPIMSGFMPMAAVTAISWNWKATFAELKLCAPPRLLLAAFTAEPAAVADVFRRSNA